MIYNKDIGKWEREDWTEWFAVSILEGRMPPRFYWPVYRERYTHLTVCWIFILAIPALIWHILYTIWMNVWYDCREFLDIMNRNWRIRRLEMKCNKNKPLAGKYFSEEEYFDEKTKENRKKCWR